MSFWKNFLGIGTGTKVESVSWKKLKEMSLVDVNSLPPSFIGDILYILIQKNKELEDELQVLKKNKTT